MAMELGLEGDELEQVGVHHIQFQVVQEGEQLELELEDVVVVLHIQILE